MAHRARRARARTLVFTLFVAVMLAGAEEGGWVLSGPVALGQTIPWLPLTLTPGATDTRLPTSTWTPLPTWTQAPTPKPVQPTTTATQLAPLATATAGPVAIPPTSVPSPTRSQPTSTASPTQQPTLVPVHYPTSTQEPAALSLEVLVDPAAAGPGDDVHFTLQVANVGRGPAKNVKIEAMLPAGLRVRSATCERCATVWMPLKTDPQAPTFLTLTSNCIASGDQIAATILSQVVEDAWPGQTIATAWLATADELLPQTLEAILDLPWAELPATGENQAPPDTSSKD